MFILRDLTVFFILSAKYLLLGRLYLGGYKSAVNVDFLKSANVRLVVCTARGLEIVLGPKFKRQARLDQREEERGDMGEYR